MLQFQGHQAIELWVVGKEHVAETSVAQFLSYFESIQLHRAGIEFAGDLSGTV